MHRTSSILFPGIIHESCLQYNKGLESTYIDKRIKQDTEIIQKFFLIFQNIYRGKQSHRIRFAS